MKISLIRLGKSQLTENDKITGLDFKEQVKKYDCNGVCEESTYPSLDLILKKSSLKHLINAPINEDF